MHQHRLNLLKYEFVHISSNFYWLLMEICKVPKNHHQIWMMFRKIRFCLDNPIFSRFHIFMKFWNFAGIFFIIFDRLCKNPSDILKYKALSFIKWKQNPNILFRSDFIEGSRKSWFLRFRINLCWRQQEWWRQQNFGDVILLVWCQRSYLQSFIWFGSVV